ncbi:Dynamin-3 [Manis pentadactyla]|nr:Dynamin-3 [Manis pentadactyla]
MFGRMQVSDAVGLLHAADHQVLRNLGIQVRLDGVPNQENDHDILQLSRQEVICPYHDLDPGPVYVFRLRDLTCLIM